MPDDTRTGQKTINRSDGVINPPQSLDLNVTDTVWDHLNRKQSKRQQTSKEELCKVFGSLGFLFFYVAIHIEP